MTPSSSLPNEVRRRVRRPRRDLSDQRSIGRISLDDRPEVAPPAVVDLLRSVEAPPVCAARRPVTDDTVASAVDEVAYAGVCVVQLWQRVEAGEAGVGRARDV